jgi:Spy/CpxP family protein refolding chaperone
MKKTIAAALTLFTLATSVTFAQGVYSRPFDNRPPQTQAPRYNNDQAQDELKIDRIDAIVGLSRRQEKQLRKIENNYDQLMASARMTPDGYRQMQLRKRQDVLAVLTSAQRDRLFAAQQPSNYNNRPTPYGRRG